MVRGNAAEPSRRRHRRSRTLWQVAGLLLRSPGRFATVLGVLALGSTIGNNRVLAADARQPDIINLTGSNQSLDADLVLICPQGGAGEPRFQHQKTGKFVAISDPRLKAVAAKACQSSVGSAAPVSSNVNIVNNTGGIIYVGFSPQSGSAITWNSAGSGCGTTSNNLTVAVQNNATCQASVTDSVASPGSRFCAVTTLGSSGSVDCSLAQQQSPPLTIVEPYFQLGCNFGAGANYPGCIFYDISVIPANCTDNLFNSSNNYCAGTGGASYNLPVMLSCSGEPTFICKGPPSTGNMMYAGAMYPANCGNPMANCIPGTNSCPNPDASAVNAYFSPTNDNPNNEPGAYCLPPNALTITFLSGP